MKQPLAITPLKGSRQDKVPYIAPFGRPMPEPYIPVPAWIKGMQGWDRGLSWIESKMMVIVGILIFALMVLVSFDAILRYSLNRPISFTVDVAVLYLLPGVLFLALSYTLRRGGHICVDLFANMVPLRVHRIIIGIALLASMLIVTMMAWKITAIAHESWILNLFASGPYAWPLWVSEAGVAFSVVVLSLRLLHMAIANLLAGITGEQAVAISVFDDGELPLGEDL